MRIKKSSNKNILLYFFSSTVDESSTHFEDLSNEIIYEIFEYLHFHHFYQTFSKLNNRYYNLIHNSTVPIKLYFPSMSRQTFENHCKDIIIPNQHRIHSIYSTNPFLFHLPPTPPLHDFAPSPFRYLSQFPRLRTLILENFESESLENLLSQLLALSHLSSLIIKPFGDVEDENLLYQQIFRLPSLRYCKVSFKQQRLIRSKPLFTTQCSGIQHLVIESHCCLNYLTVLLSHLPQLCRLSCPHLIESTLEPADRQPIVFRHLIHLSFGISNIIFDDIETFFENLSHRLEVFQLSTDFDLTYTNADRWEQLILGHLPHLRIFDLQLISRTNSNQVIPYLTISQFMSSFWLERKWFFRYEYEHSFAAFYSIKPCG